MTDIEACVIEPALLPAGGGVTVGTLPPVMFSRPVLLLVAINTIVETGMVKDNYSPVSGVVMAI